MYLAKSYRDFNTAMNASAGTSNVAYSAPWDLGVTDGKTFMTHSYDTVGRNFAQQLLRNPQESLFHNYRGQLNDVQTALLQHLVKTATKTEFDAALLPCIKHGALNNAASHFFSAPITAVEPESLAAATAVATSSVSSESQALSPLSMDVDVDETKFDMDALLQSPGLEQELQPAKPRLAAMNGRSGGAARTQLAPKRKKPKT